MNPADRDRIIELLQDPTRSCRAISRQMGYSDWTIRKIARELDGDPRPMRSARSSAHDPSEEISTLGCWLIGGGFIALLAFAIWAGAWQNPPQEP